MLKTAQLNTKAFTMIELLIVVSIIAIMTGALIPSFTSYTRNQELRQGQEQLVNDLFTVQNNALSGKKNFEASTVSHWGLRFNGTRQYEYVTANITPTNTDPCGSATQERSANLSENLIVTSSSSTCVFFALANGNSYLSTDKNVYVKRSGSSTECFKITISEVGLITRVKDILTTCP